MTAREFTAACCNNRKDQGRLLADLTTHQASWIEDMFGDSTTVQGKPHPQP